MSVSETGKGPAPQDVLDPRRMMAKAIRCNTERPEVAPSSRGESGPQVGDRVLGRVLRHGSDGSATDEARRAVPAVDVRLVNRRETLGGGMGARHRLRKAIQESALVRAPLQDIPLGARGVGEVDADGNAETTEY